MLEQMNHRDLTRRTALLVLAGLLGLPGGSPAAAPGTASAEGAAGTVQDSQAAKASVKVSGTPAAAETEPYYGEVLEAWQKEKVQAGAGEIVIDAAAPAGQSDSGAFIIGPLEGKARALQWKNTGENWVEYRFTVPADGLYEIHVSYRPLPAKGIGGAIVWDLTLDGRRPYRETSSITLYRDWRDERPIRKNDDGDEVRPRSVEVPAWKQTALTDGGGAYGGPLLWRFTAGEHTLRISGSQPVALEKLILKAPRSTPAYAEAAAAYPAAPAPGRKAQAEVLTIQAEDLLHKNDTSIKLFSDTDARTVPVAKGRITYNTVGGRRWLYHNQEITWKVNVPETGLYKLAFRSLQNQFAQKSSFRTVRIDGQVPFRELTAFRFPYASDWRGILLGPEEEEPYGLYLTAGEHTVSLAVTHAPLKPVLTGIEELTELLRTVEDDLRSLTGGIVDRNRTWKLQQELPDLTPRLEEAAKRMVTLGDSLQEINGGKDSISQGIRNSADDVRELLEKVDDIPYYTDQISSMKEKISGFTETLLQQPLQLDELYLAPVDREFPDMEASWLSSAFGTAQNFIYSFDARNSLKNMDDRVLNVWVQRGRDYVDQLQQLSDELFTPETGIKVKVNLLPNAQLLVMSNAAGVQPDVALGLTQDLPVDYAIRGSVHDLSRYPDFKEIQQKFSPGSWLPLHYNGGYYALPETQSFQVLYYRKDILKGLGLPVPQTWDDVYALLPVLQQNALNFYMNPKDFTPFFYQNGTDLYRPDGLKTALDTPEGFRAFKMWTDLFNTYALEKEVPSFYQHFRRGTMPIGVSDYNLYVQLAAAAPELNGRWGIAEIPGVKQADGSIVRWAGGGQRTSVIFERSNKKDQAWAFLKWWVSDEVQERYGNDIEAVNGVAFRWNTSNVNAFAKLPWKREDAEVILDQWRWYKDIPNLPGGYFLEREIHNAWLRSVVDGLNYRTSLETAVLDIDRELRRKQLEFGFVDASGRVVRTLDVPAVKEPWKGVDPYAE
ncbi:ABC transporter substrate-binding protein [Paenibacillus mucilaginosus K02]|uniref:ABC transporter substrate-binding protein n=2 Tax=Paenibacillus mucilaginosus TaxID=61624 RepID=I0BL17_9BACL|nr:ABC transporter substrate-binding protein [Paenibacillus mucilaginosus K02]